MPSDQSKRPNLFPGLVMSLGASAMEQLGQFAEPGGKPHPPDLNAAEATIDLLAMLETKTKGNLDEAEARMLRDTLYSLRMLYVQAKTTAPRPEASAPPPDNAQAANPAAPGAAKPAASDPQDSRFHKSYG